MINSFIERTENWPAIIQGTIGSFIFWIILELMKLVINLVQKIAFKKWALNRDSLLQEYIYRKFTSRDGFVPMVSGLLVSFSYALKNLLFGLLFISISFLIGGYGNLIRGICLGSAMYFIIKALLWVIPRWEVKNMNKNWSRVENLESILFGNLEKRTEDNPQNN